MIRIMNILLKQLNKKSYKAFVENASRAMEVQETYLFKCLYDNQGTEFGIDYDFSKIKSVKQFQEQVPMTDYEMLEPYIESHSIRNEKGLVNEAVLLFEPSSGSTSGSKLIPYTKGLKEDFMKGIKPWLYNLYTYYNRLQYGTTYWSISPVNKENRRTVSGVPIGFEDDAGYFGVIENVLFKRLFSVPSQVKYIEDIEDFRYVTMAFLLADEKLGLISVWNPTFLTLLLDQWDIHSEAFIDNIQKGRLTPPNGTDLAMVITKQFNKNTKRANNLRKYNKTRAREDFFKSIWPKLSVVSCWTHSHSENDAMILNKRLRGIHIQGKGLLATEGLISIPLVDTNRALHHVISYTSHFFEFIEIDKESMEVTQNICLLEHLEKGKLYSVLMTTRGGLYRYRIYDLVEVVDFYMDLPCIRFVGKEANVVDFYGEKLNEIHVKRVLHDIIHFSGFYFVAPCNALDGFRYCLFIEDTDNIEMDFIEIAKKFEEGLCKNYHYAYARKLKQLESACIYVMEKGHMDNYYQHISEVKKMKLGDIKYMLLNNIVGFEKKINGFFA
ncbi:MAG: GH3 auxin-responsive promoter family protein [Vallitaleaceae bacterium]|nr:GH3 auxin-responsive promoter family protein [Vallitaleaceae bacterium]